MNLIDWSDEFSVGIASIDEQHKKLVNMINALHAALMRGEAATVLAKIFAGLLVYTDKHFKYEESLLEEHSWPGGFEHRTMHENLLSQVLELKTKFDAGNTMAGIQVMKFLKDWLTNHILKCDKSYSEYLRSKGVA